MRIALGQLWQETNTFNRNPTTRDDFEHWGVAVGDAVLERYGDTGELRGFLSAARESTWAGAEAAFAGLARFACWPWGAVDRAAWDAIREAFADRLAAAGRVQAVFLALHGAMSAEGEDDVTGALLEQARAAVGPEVPIVGSLDLHANVTPRMIAAADLLVGYHTCPHLDAVETGARAAAGLRRLIEEKLRPVTYWRKLPMITAAEYHNTFTGPPAPLYARLKELEAEPEVLSAGVYMVMPWFDCPHLGWSVTLTTTRRDARWQRIVNELAAACWDLREPLERVERHPPERVVEMALAHGGHPVVIGDAADATNSGAPGDSTHLLRELLRREAIPHGAVTFLVDPRAVALAAEAGPGGAFDAPVGAGFSPEWSEPVRFRGMVERLLEVEFVLDGHISRNLPVRMGRGAVVRSGDVTVLFVERSGPGSTPRLYETAGIDPRTKGIVVAKSPAGFRADYGPFAAAIYLADCPGCASPAWDRLTFSRAHRPLWPLDPIRRPDEAD